jgi:ABC-type amino acid transport substrate-binding protein
VLQQISYLPERAKAVDLSDGYYDVNQALVSVQGSRIATATSFDELKDATLGAPIGTTSLEYIEDTIRPSAQPTVYDDLPAAVQGLKNGQVDGIVVDLPSASYVTAVQVPQGVIVGRFPTVDSRVLRDGVREGEPVRAVREPRPPGDEGRRHARRDPPAVARGLGRRADDRILRPVGARC